MVDYNIGVRALKTAKFQILAAPNLFFFNFILLKTFQKKKPSRVFAQIIYFTLSAPSNSSGLLSQITFVEFLAHKYLL